jgi:hypothetical protein
MGYWLILRNILMNNKPNDNFFWLCLSIVIIVTSIVSYFKQMYESDANVKIAEIQKAEELESWKLSIEAGDK